MNHKLQDILLRTQLRIGLSTSELARELELPLTMVSNVQANLGSLGSEVEVATMLSYNLDEYISDDDLERLEKICDKAPIWSDSVRYGNQKVPSSDVEDGSVFLMAQDVAAIQEYLGETWKDLGNLVGVRPDVLSAHAKIDRAPLCRIPLCKKLVQLILNTTEEGRGLEDVDVFGFLRLVHTPSNNRTYDLP